MCGRVTTTSSTDDLVAFLSVDRVDIEGPIAPRYNVAPTDPVPMVVETGGERRLTVERWGLVPHWGGAPLINARAERLATSPAFARSFERRRCLIPVDGFYEWQRRADGAKQPMHIGRRDGFPLALAGLYGEGCTIVTCEPNALLAPIHDRMPVILPAEVWEPWLDPDNRDVASLEGVLRPVDPQVLEAYPVGPAVNSVANDGPHLVDPADWQPTLFEVAD